MNSKYNRAILIGVLGGILVVVCALGATAQTLMSAKEIGKSITVGIETTAASTLERSYDNNTPDIIRYSTRWKPSERFLTVSATPLRQLTVSTKLDIGGNIEDKPRSVNPVTGIIFDSEILRGFVGDVHHFELETSWRFNKFISATAGYMRYELAQESELRY
ncbi:MAG TPA: hypothetical protein VEC17_00435, partial [Candidatus Binatia bacterium]|nr:hypothetical protein [Candidatus Binatia bacterium]